MGNGKWEPNSLLTQYSLNRKSNTFSTHLTGNQSRCDGVEVRASASQSVDLGFITLVDSYQKTLKMVSIASLFDAQHLWEVVENKPASSLGVSLGKAPNGMLHLYVKDR